MKRSLLIALIVACHVNSTVAATESEPGAIRESQQLVIFIGSSSEEQLTLELVEAIEQRIFDLDVSILVHWIDATVTTPASQVDSFDSVESSEVIAFMWLEQREEGDKVVIISSKAGGTWSLTRRVDLTSSQAAQEELGMMVRTFLTALFAEQVKKESPAPEQKMEEVTASTDRDESPEEEKAEPLEPMHQPRFSIFTGYALSFDSEQAAPIQGFSMILGFKIVDWMRAYLGYAFFERARIETIQTDLTLSRHPFELGLGIGTPVNRLKLSGSLGVSLDYVTIGAEPHSSTFVLDDHPDYLQVALVPMCTLEYQIAVWLRLYVRLGGDILLKRPRFTAGSPEHEETIYEPWPVHPKGSLGLVFTLF